ncbi:MAG: FHA domain-containing protein [Sandaracinaceae bacterium]
MPRTPASYPRPFVLVLNGPGSGRILPVRDGEEVRVGRAADAHLHVPGDEVSRDHVRIRNVAGEVWLEDLGSRNGTLLNGRHVERSKLADGDTIQVGSRTVLKVRLTDRTPPRPREAPLAHRDHATDLLDGSYLDQRVASEAAYAERCQHPLALLVLRVDPPTRSRELLDKVARRLEQGIRSEDVLTRLESSSFGILCRGLDEAGALRLARRLRRAFAPPDPKPGRWLALEPSPTLSIGVASLDVAPPDELLGAADSAARRAQDEGGDRVALARAPWPRGTTR